MWSFMIVFVSIFQMDYAQQVPSLTIIPESTEQPREGDGVTLECRLRTAKPSTGVFRWEKTNTSGLVSLEAGGRLLFSPLVLVNSTGPVYSQNLTINSVREYDEGEYKCFSAFSTHVQAQLSVFEATDFPICSPSGPAVVTNGSKLSCRSLTDTRTLDVAEFDSMFASTDWMRLTSAEGSGEEEFTKIATTSDNGTGFNCFSFSENSPLALSCRIGPLTVTETSEGGLSVSDIVAIVLGSIVLLIVIALHVLYCRCNPRKWRQTKSYILDVGNSYGFLNRRSEQADEELAVESSNSPEATNDLQTSEGVDSEKRVCQPSDLQEVEACVKTGNANGECIESSNKYQLNTSFVNDIRMVGDQNNSSHVDNNVTIDIETPDPNETDSPIYDNAKPGKLPEDHGEETELENKPKKVQRFAFNRKNKAAGPSTSDVDQASGKGAQNDPSVIYAKVNKQAKVQNGQDLSAIYAKVNKQAKGRPAAVQGSSQAEKISKKIKRFAFHRKGKVDKPSEPEHVLVYADLDLTGNETGGVRPSKEPKTAYAEIAIKR